MIPSIEMCTNYHRIVHDDHENNDNMQLYRIQLQQILSNTLSHKKFKSIKSIQGNTRSTFHLCQDCVKYLGPSEEQLTGSGRELRDKEVMWCSFMWYMLSNPDIHKCYGDSIWSYVLKEWRPWWKHSLITEFPAVFSNITMDFPCPAIKDKTLDRDSCDLDIKSYHLPRLTNAWNHYFRPLIKCPWGCSEFLHNVGFVPLDIMFRRLLQ